MTKMTTKKMKKTRSQNRTSSTCVIGIANAISAVYEPDLRPVCPLGNLELVDDFTFSKSVSEIMKIVSITSSSSGTDSTPRKVKLNTGFYRK